MSRLRTLALAAAAATLLPPAVFAMRTGSDWGPFGARYEDARGVDRTKFLGPVFEWAESPDGAEMRACRPFTSMAESTNGERQVVDVLWPVASWWRRGAEEQWRFVICTGLDKDAGDPLSPHRVWIPPFWFHGINATGSPYHALFPVGGTICDFISRDEIAFALFPLYVRTRINEVETRTWLWPVFSKTEGDGIERHRVFPFYDTAHLEGQFDKRFVLWPFWVDATYYYEGATGGGWILVPLFGRMTLEDQDTTWVLPPLFRYTRTDEGGRLLAPWPFVQWNKSKDFKQVVLLPLYGRKEMPDYDRTWFMFPLVWNIQSTRPGEVTRRFIIAPFFYSERTREVDAGGSEGGVLRQHNRVWPLYSYREAGEDSRLRVPELWPFAPHEAVDRNWAPLWTLYSRDRHGGNIDHELLWGLYRRQVREDGARHTSVFPLVEWDRDGGRGRSWSLLKGLIGHAYGGSKRELRLLYFIRLGRDVEMKP